jgi:hypothetical protein
MKDATRADHWQPIVTAPRDGSRVLLWYPPTREDAGVAAEGFFDALFDGVWMVSRGSSHIDRRVRKPTHWMPMPDGPVMSGKVKPKRDLPPITRRCAVTPACFSCCRDKPCEYGGDQ